MNDAFHLFFKEGLPLLPDSCYDFFLLLWGEFLIWKKSFEINSWNKIKTLRTE